MQNKKLMVIPMLLIFALVLTGFAYAHWEKIITINGTVETGSVHVEVLSASSDDPPGTIDVGKTKDVGCTTVSRGEDKQSITVTITNAYPCYEVYVHFTVKNTGTIPVHFKGIYPQPPFEFDGVKTWKAIFHDGKITVWGWDGLDEQLHPGDPGDYTIWIHVEQPAEQLTTYTFTAEAVFTQYNY